MPYRFIVACVSSAGNTASILAPIKQPDIMNIYALFEQVLKTRWDNCCTADYSDGGGVSATKNLWVLIKGKTGEVLVSDKDARWIVYTFGSRRTNAKQCYNLRTAWEGIGENEEGLHNATVEPPISPLEIIQAKRVLNGLGPIRDSDQNTD